MPFEDALSITLTDGSLRPLDYAWLGSAYATGVWRDPAIDGPGAISFRFIDDERWRLGVLAAPRFGLPGLGEPAGVHRRFGFMRRFAVSAETP